MAITDFDEVKTYFETNKDSDDVKNYIGGLFTSDRVNSFLESENGKKLIQPKLDSYATKAITTHDEKFKANELPKLVDEQYKKLHPDADPKDTEIAKLKTDFENMKKEALRKDLTNHALKIAGEKKLPASIINYFIGDDEETTNKNLEALEKAFNESVNSVAEERLKSGYKPPKSDDSKTFSMEQIKAMTPKQINENWDAVQATLKSQRK